MNREQLDSSDRIRMEVSKAYARAAMTAAPTSSCDSQQKGQAVKFAGYCESDLGELPEESVVNSFGCGNPLAFAAVQQGQVVLDLGSGAGIDLLLAARRVGTEGRVIGVDMTDEMIARARSAIRSSGHGNVEVRKGIIEELPVDSGSVDWVISNCVINLSPQKERVFAEIARVLKPGGRMRVSDIVVQDLPVEVSRDQQFYNSCIAGAVSEEEYVAGLRRAGMVDVLVQDRIVYDAAQLLAIAGSGEGGCGCQPTTDREAASEIARALEGNVWSATIVARKADAAGS